MGHVNEKNREALAKHREEFEQRMQEMEEEVTKVQLSRYKIELEQKQKFLNTSKKYEEHFKEYRAALAYVLSLVGVSHSLESDCSQIRQKELIEILEQCKSSLETKGTDYKKEYKTLKKSHDELVQCYRAELNMRRHLHNKLQEVRGNIRVLCRVRPMLSHEKKQFAQPEESVQVVNRQRLYVDGKDFGFDHVFDLRSGQKDVFEEAAGLVTSCLDGYNVCIMAYGQTGSGKTYTMVGTESHPGLYFTSVEELFQLIEERKKSYHYEVSVGIVEIYNDTIRDLLNKKNPGCPVRIRDTSDGEVSLPD